MRCVDDHRHTVHKQVYHFQLVYCRASYMHEKLCEPIKTDSCIFTIILCWPSPSNHSCLR